MVWEESKHPRDEDGKFTDGAGQSKEARRKELERRYNSEYQEGGAISGALILICFQTWKELAIMLKKNTNLSEKEKQIVN